MHLVLAIDIDGTVDQAGLDRLRAHLNLTKAGRLTDDWDYTLGRRMIGRSAGQYLMISLCRNDYGSWKVSVFDTDDRDPNDPELTALRAELLGGIVTAGFTASVRVEPN